MSQRFAFPYQAAHFNKNGQQKFELSALPTTSDVLLISHGWNNDEQEAQEFYDKLLENMQALCGKDLPAGRSLSVVGIFWPSKKFNFADREARSRGPAAAAGGGNADGDALVQDALDNLRMAFEDEEADKQVLVEQIARLTQHRHADDVSNNGAELVNVLRQLLKDMDLSRLDWSREFMSAGDASTVFERAADAPPVTSPVAAGGAAAGIGDLLDRIDNGFENLLNLTSYYKMKTRAGKVGTEGVARLIDNIARAETVQHIHLVGHSFGARLMTAAAMASTTKKLYSMTLLQAAFSHNGFSETDPIGKYPTGYFRSVIESNRVSGPIVVTHSKHDRDVCKAYAIASRISGDIASDLGGKTDLYGGMGANGALRVGGAFLNTAISSMGPVGKPYSFAAGRVHNLNSNTYISDHGDVRNREVAWALGQVIGGAN